MASLGGAQKGEKSILKNLLKSSSHEPTVRLTSYLTYRVLKARSTKFANKKKFWRKMASLEGAHKGEKFNFEKSFKIFFS